MNVIKKLLVFSIICIIPVTSSIAATITVTTASDSGVGSLRQAIITSNADTTTDTIQFNASLAGQTITLLSPLPAIAKTTKTLTITGAAAAGLTISGGNLVSVFEVDSGTVTIQNLIISNAAAIGTSGGNAASGGGGGGGSLGSGGAIYVEGGTVTISQVTFTNNSATGGAGGTGTAGSAGGGGGGGGFGGSSGAAGLLTVGGNGGTGDGGVFGGGGGGGGGAVAGIGGSASSGGTAGGNGSISAGGNGGAGATSIGGGGGGGGGGLGGATGGTGGAGGFGAGSGGAAQNGGSGGSGFGGAIFLGQGVGTVSIANCDTSGSSVTAGSGGTGVVSGASGAAQGQDLYIMSGATASFNIAAATTHTMNGSIEGSGGITKITGGTLVLNGANTYSGGTTVTTGTLSGTTTSLQGNITDNGAVTFNQSTDGTYASVLSGSGSVSITGTADVTFSGANTYNGGSTVSAGTLTGTTTSLQGNIVDNAAVVFNQATSGTYAGKLSGTGSVTLSGVGDVTFSGTNSYSGGTTVSAGTLMGGSASVQGNIVNDAVVVFTESSGGTYSGALSGTGSVTKTGTATLTFSGTNSYGGGTTVSAGTLTGTTANLQGNIVDNATVTFSQATDGTYAGVLSGTGNVTKSGAGNLTFSGLNTYSAGTTVSAGTLTGTTSSLQGNIVDDASVVFNQATDGTYAGVLSGNGSVTLAGAANITFSGANSYSGGTTVSAGTLTGTTTSLQRNIVDNSAVVFNQATSGTYAGILSGSGSVTLIGVGDVTFSGVNSYSGGTTVSAGTLTGSTSSLPGNIVDNAAVVFNQATSATYAGVISGSGSVTKSGNGNVTFSGLHTYSGGTTVSGGTLTGTTSSLQGNIVDDATVTFNQAVSGTYASVLSGTGGVTISGGGDITFTGLNSYSGGTTVSAGTLMGTTSSLQGNIVDNAAVAFNQAADGTYAGKLSGTGSVTLSGAGNVTFSGANTYSGGTTVSAGTLTGSTTSLQGNITDNAAVVFNQATSATYAGVISGTGTVTLIGVGDVTFSGANTYSGGTTVSAGTLTGSTTSLQGNITDNASVVFSQTTTGTYAGVISGSGSVTKSGAGNVTFSGLNSYSGGTTVTTGTLTGTTTSLQGSIVDNAAVAFTQATDGTYSGVLSGTGSVAVSGTANVTFSGANTYSGGTTVSGGSLIGTTTSLQRNIVDNASVVFNQATSGTYAGILSGTGSVTLAGIGDVTFSGANTYSGGTTVSAGTLMGTTTSLQRNIVDNAAVVFNQATTGTYAGVLSGSGSVTLAGIGNITFSGANSYGGGTTVSAGTLTGTTTSLQGNIVDNATVAFNQATSGTYAGVISGTGSVTKSGTGDVTFSGLNSYSGGTTVSTGTLMGTTSSLQGNIVDNAAVAFTQATDGTYSGVLSGAGSVAVSGTANVTFSGANTYSGGTTVSGGSLIGTTTSLQRNIVDNASVVFNQATSGTYAGVLSGTGSVTLAGIGGVTFSGANTYSGGTTVLGGTLTGTTTSLQGNITDNAVVVFNQATNGTYTGALSGTGSVTVSGTGNVTFGGTNSYSGGTTILGGILTGTTTSLQGNITDNASIVFNQATDGTYAGVLSGTGGVMVSGGGNVTFSGVNSYSGGTTVSGGTLTGTTTSLQGNITDNAVVAFNQATDGTYASVLSGTGGVTISGGGNITLSGANSYSGGTTVSGGTLTGTTTSLQGNITDNAAVVFNQATDGTYAGVLSGTGGVTVSGGGNITFSGANSYSGGTTVLGGTLTGTTASLQGDITDNASIVFNQATDGTYSGALSGTGNVTVSGTGNITFSGTNSYSGGTTVLGGTLTGTTASLQGNIADNTSVIFNQATDGTYAGILSGAGSVTVAGTGNVTFSGANVYSGGTTVSDGTLTGTTASLQGNIVNNATVDFNQSTNGTYAGVISGVGNVIKDNTGTVALGSVQTYTGSTTVNNGSLQLLQSNTLANSSTITVNSPGILDLNNFNESIADLEGNGSVSLGSGVLTLLPAGTSTFTGNISGVGGSLVQSGTGTQILTGSNTYTGGTSILSGVLNVSTNSLPSGPIVDNASLVFNQPTDASFSGVVSGTGTLTKDGAGNLTLSNPQTYTGDTIISNGTLSLSSANQLVSSNIVLSGATSMLDVNNYDQSYINVSGAGGVNLGNGTLTVAPTGSITLSGPVIGSGGFIKNGSGTMELANTNSYTGTTVVNAGILTVNGNTGSSDFTVHSGTTLTGNATVKNLNNFGTVSPGNSIGTIVVNGHYTSHFESVLTIEIDPMGHSDLVQASGSATIIGGIVMFSPTDVSTNFSEGTVYTFLTAAGGVSGHFLTVKQFFPELYLSPVLIYNPNSVQLLLTVDMNAMADDMDFDVYDPYLRKLTPMAYIVRSHYELLHNIRMNNLIEQRIADVRHNDDKTEANHFNAQYVGDVSQYDSDDLYPGYTAADNGFLISMDRQLNDEHFLGMTASYASSFLKFKECYGSTHLDNYRLALYGGYDKGLFFMNYSLGAGLNASKMRRCILFDVVNRWAFSDTVGGHISSMLTFGGRYHYDPFTIEPFVRFDAIGLREPKVNEDGAEELDIAMKPAKTNAIAHRIGTRLYHDVELPRGGTMQAQYSIAKSFQKLARQKLKFGIFYDTDNTDLYISRGIKYNPWIFSLDAVYKNTIADWKIGVATESYKGNKSSNLTFALSVGF